MKRIEYTDKEIVEAILANDDDMIEHFLFRECKPLFSYIIHSIFEGRVERNELINDFFLYLRQNDWYKIRQFDFRSKLTTWISVVAIRYFQKKRTSMLDFCSIDALNEHEAFLHEIGVSHDCQMDVRDAIERMPNQRYQYVLTELELKERVPEEIAQEMNITIDNLYNIRHRARLQLKTIMRRKEDYYG